MSVECRRIVPERPVPYVGHHLNLSVSQVGFVLIDGGWFEIRVLSAMHNQDGLADRRQKIVIVDRAGKSA